MILYNTTQRGLCVIGLSDQPVGPQSACWIGIISRPLFSVREHYCWARGRPIAYGSLLTLSRFVNKLKQKAKETLGYLTLAMLEIEYLLH